MGRRAVFLDRDGVLNSYVYNAEFGTVDSPSNRDEFELIPGVPNAIAALRSMGFILIVVSNQPGIAKGKFSAELLAAMTCKMMDECGDNIADVFYCLHHPQAKIAQFRGDCSCRKPKPGLLLEAAAKWDIDMAASFMVGDGITDVIAGRDAGAKTILVNVRKCYLCEEMAKHDAIPDFFATNLLAAVDTIREQLKTTVGM